MKTIGLKLLSSLVSTGELETYLKMRLDTSIFIKSEEHIFEFIDEHIHTYSVLPAVDTVNEYLSSEGYSLPSAKEVPQFYYDETTDRFITNSMKRSISEAKSALITDPPKEVLGNLINDFVALAITKNDNDIVNFNNAGEILHTDYMDKVKNNIDNTVDMGWPYLDNMSQGMQPGDLISLIGRPGQGKTFQMLYAAHQAWLNQNKTVLFVSMEMLPIPIMQRLAAIHSKYNLTALKSVPMTTKGYDHVFGELIKMKNHPSQFWVVDGNLSATIEDIWSITRQLKPDAVYVDGAYLVKTNSKHYMSKWDRIGYVAEELKSRVATLLKVPVFASYQFNKTMVKKKDTSEVGLDDIYGSDVIAQVSSVVLGLFEEDTVESLIKKKVSLLKGRNGEVGSFDINWDFIYMDFSEIPAEKKDNQKQLTND